MDQSLLAHLTSVFREEANESLDNLRSAMEQLEDGEESRLAECLRLAHNVKGAASAVGLEDFAALAHVLEDFFTLHMDREQRPGSELLGEAAKARTELERLAHGAAPESTVDAWCERLKVPPPETAPPHADADSTSALAQLPSLGEQLALKEELAPAVPSNDVRPESRFTRVEMKRLDELAVLSGQLLATLGGVLARRSELSRIVEELADELNRGAAKRETHDGLLRSLRHLLRQDKRETSVLGAVQSEFGASLRSLRMTRLENAQSSWQHTVADAASRLGKDVRLYVDVSGVEIDKQVLERLQVPIAHVLRNAVAHGIETPEIRFEKAKPRRGQIQLQAALENGLVCLSIEDDGCGIDLGAVGHVAAKRGLIPAQDADSLSFQDATQLLLTPGFSTNKTADRVSGRGVGLGDVHEVLSVLGGSLSIQPAQGIYGTRFELRFPVSVLATRGLVVREQAQLYALPTTSVLRVDPLASGPASQDPSKQTLQLEDGEVVHLRTLSSLCGATTDEKKRTATVLLQTPDGRVATAVDEVLAESELVVKPLPWNMQGQSCFSGITALGDGQLVLMIEPANFNRDVRKPEGKTSRAAPRVLVVDDSVTRRTLHYNIMRQAGYQVASAVDGSDAWTQLQASAADIVVSDVQMPVLDGLQLTQKIRKDARLKSTPVVLVTGLAESEDEQRGLAAGANAYVRKQNFDHEQLLEVVAQLLEQRA